MKTIGLIGGMSWESTADYYRILNETIKQELGGLHSAKCIVYSVDFAEIEKYQFAGQWEKSAQVLTDAALALEKAGADCLLLCTNTMHKVAPAIEAKVGIPFLHIAQATADELRRDGITKVGLLGTRFTMEEAFYKERLVQNGISVLVPPPQEREKISDIIYNELCLGKKKAESKAFYLQTVEHLHAAGAQAVILGCTEIGMLITQSDTSVPLYDTTRIHAVKAALLSLE